MIHVGCSGWFLPEVVGPILSARHDESRHVSGALRPVVPVGRSQRDSGTTGWHRIG